MVIRIWYYWHASIKTFFSLSPTSLMRFMSCEANDQKRNIILQYACSISSGHQNNFHSILRWHVNLLVEVIRPSPSCLPYTHAVCGALCAPYAKQCKSFQISLTASLSKCGFSVSRHLLVCRFSRNGRYLLKAHYWKQNADDVDSVQYTLLTIFPVPMRDLLFRSSRIYGLRSRDSWERWKQNMISLIACKYGVQIEMYLVGHSTVVTFERKTTKNEWRRKRRWYKNIWLLVDTPISVIRAL